MAMSYIGWGRLDELMQIPSGSAIHESYVLLLINDEHRVSEMMPVSWYENPGFLFFYWDQ